MHSPLEIRNSGTELNSNSKLSKQIYIFDIILSLKGYRMRSRSCCCFPSSLCLSSADTATEQPRSCEGVGLEYACRVHGVVVWKPSWVESEVWRRSEGERDGRGRRRWGYLWLERFKVFDVERRTGWDEERRGGFVSDGWGGWWRDWGFRAMEMERRSKGCG